MPSIAVSMKSSSAQRFGVLRAIPRVMTCEEATVCNEHGAGCTCDEEPFRPENDDRDDLEDDTVYWPPEHIRVGFARRLLDA